MRVTALIATMVAVLCWSAATAFPDGSPWGAANPAADQNCATCHFGADPVLDSPSLTLEGLPENPQPGQTYALRVEFDDPEIVTSGFQLFAQADNERTGTFVSTDSNVEFIGAAIRSTATVPALNGVHWQVDWRTPADIELPIVFYVAASAANDDGSPFGDTVHFRCYRIADDTPANNPGSC